MRKAGRSTSKIVVMHMGTHQEYYQVGPRGEFRLRTAAAAGIFVSSGFACMHELAKQTTGIGRIPKGRRCVELGA